VTGSRCESGAAPLLSSGTAAARRDRATRNAPRFLCGHTHSGGDATILSNLRVLTGAADYGAPVVRVLDVSGRA
jgi:hypothetical protein